MRNVIVAVLVTALCLLVSRAAHADVTITEETEILADGQTSISRIFVSPTGVRIDGEEGGSRQTMLFRADRELFWMIDHDGGTYMEMTADDMERMAAQMQEATAQFGQLQQQIQAELEGLSDEERQLIEQALGGRGFGAAPGFGGRGGGPPIAQPVIEYRLVDSGEQIGEWSTTHYEGTISGARFEEVWTIDWSDADVTAADFAAFESLAEMMESMAAEAPGFPEFFEVDTSEEGPYQGIPVRRISYENGQAARRSNVTDINHSAIDPAMFELPEGLSRQSMPGF